MGDTIVPCIHTYATARAEKNACTYSYRVHGIGGIVKAVGIGARIKSYQYIIYSVITYLHGSI